jgi:RNA polymerase sigma-70 factor, ECF subfamily
MASDDREFTEQLIRNQHRIFAYVATLVPNRDDAEDIFQNTCLVLWKKWKDFSLPHNFFGWACGVAYNEIRNKVRTSQQHRLQLSEDVLAQIAETRSHTEQLLETRSRFLGPCLEKLPDEQHQLIERCYLDDEPINAVANEMNISPAALTMRLQRIRKTLFNCVELASSNQGEVQLGSS